MSGLRLRVGMLPPVNTRAELIARIEDVEHDMFIYRGGHADAIARGADRSIIALMQMFIDNRMRYLAELREELGSA